MNIVNKIAARETSNRTVILGLTGLLVAGIMDRLPSGSKIEVDTIHGIFGLDLNASENARNAEPPLVDALFIDEVSMMSVDMWNKIDILIKAIRMKGPCFVLLCTDPDQLPPLQGQSCFHERNITARWSISSLSKQHRSLASDELFDKLLAEMRTGCIARRTYQSTLGRFLIDFVGMK